MELHKSTLPNDLFTSEQVRQAELAAVTSGKHSLYDLVEQAGKAATDCLLTHCVAEHSLVLVGVGNNGSDALVLARRLKKQGKKLTVLRLAAEHYSKEQITALAKFKDAGGRVQLLSKANLEQSLLNCDCVIDGLLGTGCKEGLRPSMVTLVALVNQSGKFVLSLDVPSGVNSDTGRVGLQDTPAIKASVTICFGGLKQGLFTADAREFCGEIEYNDVGLADFLPRTLVSLVARSYLTQRFQPRNRNGHKGHFGKVCVIGGDFGMAGAIRLAAEGCQRVGAGLVKVVSRTEHQLTVNIGRPELMFHACDDVNDVLLPILNWADVHVLGPGLGTESWGAALFAMMDFSKPLVLDADGLNLLARNPKYNEKWILTPHPGEAARLLETNVKRIEQDRFAAVRLLQQTYGGVVVLKGAGSLICNGFQTYVAPVGNPGMASGGFGDVLSGVIGGLLAQGMDLFSAAVAGVLIHGLAADTAALQGERGMLASDLLPHIRSTANLIC